jgi:hypothetical protein
MHRPDTHGCPVLAELVLFSSSRRKRYRSMTRLPLLQETTSTYYQRHGQNNFYRDPQTDTTRTGTDCKARRPVR